MANKRIKLNNGEWCDDTTNEEYKKIAKLNQDLKPFMKDAINAQIRYNDFKEMFFEPDDPNRWGDWWGEWKSRKFDEIDGLFFQTEEAVKEAYYESKTMKFRYEAYLLELQTD